MAKAASPPRPADATQPTDSQTVAEAHGTDPPARRSLLKLLLRPVSLLVMAAILALLAWGGQFLWRRSDKPPATRLQQALQALDEHRDTEARDVAKKLEDAGYLDSEFPGGVAFVLGVAAFREAGGDDDVGRDQKYSVAVAQLRAAEKQTLVAERRPQWAFTLGVGLHRLGAMDEAVPFLEESIKDYPPGKVEAALLLADTLLLSHIKTETEQALKLNTMVVSQADLPQSERDHALLQRAQILLALGQRAEAQAAVGQVSKENLRHQVGIVLRAQVLMRDNRFREASQLLGPIAASKDPPRTYPAQASLLMAVCADRLGELENAITLYQRTAERFEHSHEALAAQLGAGEALLKVGRNEEALENFGSVLKSVRNPQQFRNRWVTLTRLRETVQQAWSAWLERHCYSEAIALAELMTPAVPREEATELAARASQKWAEHLEAETLRLSIDRQAERREPLNQRWRRCGQAYSDLATSRQTLASHTAALWMAADSFVKGGDFVNAAARYSDLIATRVATIVPQASVQRGQAYLNLDRLDDALADFQKVVTSHPNDAAAFQARYLLGQCQLERNQPAEAEKVWKEILESTELAPTALEWRRALLALGRLHFATADAKLVVGTNALESAGTDKQAREKAQESLQQAYSQFDTAVAELDEFCDRYPDAAETLETRYLLAKSLQKSSRRFQDNLRSAETDYTRTEIRRLLRERMELAVAHLQKVQSELQDRLTAKQLDAAGKTMLQNCFFDIAAALFMLERYEDAISAYGKAAGRLQQHPEALLAYVQIANCYDRLKKPAEALSTLAQAKILLEQLPERDFPLGQSRLTKIDWQKWLDWAMKLHD